MEYHKQGALKKAQQNYENYINLWLDNKVDGSRGKGQISNHVRRYLFEKNQNKCSQCGWSKKNQFTNKIPLEVDHIDGNSDNNSQQNLRLLCPNCHSLTKTYKGANKGRGRHNRKQRYQERKSY